MHHRQQIHIGKGESEMTDATPVDLGNNLLGPTPAQMACSRTTIPDADGNPVTLIVITIRTPSTTFTVFLDEKSAAQWASDIGKTSRAGSSALIVPTGLPPLEPGITEALRQQNGGRA
jgi:hypothetical protein